MNERQKVNKIIHTYVDVNKYEDYTDYKGLITALIDWKNEQLTLTDVVGQSEQLSLCQCDKPSPDIMYGKTCTECCLEIDPKA